MNEQDRDGRLVTATGQYWNQNIWWYRWLVLWRDIAHASIPRVGGPCDHRRCNEHLRHGGCRSFAITAEQMREYKRLGNSDLPVGVSG